MRASLAPSNQPWVAAAAAANQPWVAAAAAAVPYLCMLVLGALHARMLQSGHGTKLCQVWLKEVLKAKVTGSQCWWEKGTPENPHTLGPGTEGSPCCRWLRLKRMLQVLANLLPWPMPSQPTSAWAAQVICDSWAGGGLKEKIMGPLHLQYPIIFLK